MNSYSIYLVRHGESIMNTRQNPEGIPDPYVHLTETGIAQAESTGKFFYDLFGSALLEMAPCQLFMYASPFKRTRQTANIIANQIGLTTDCIREDFRLREQSFGLLDLVPKEKWRKEFPDAMGMYDKLLEYEGRFYAAYPGGESFAQVCDRLSSFKETIFRRMYKHKVKRIIAVSHGLAIRAFVIAWMGYEPEWLSRTKNPHNCSVHLIEKKEGQKPTYQGEIFVPKGAKR